MQSTVELIDERDTYGRISKTTQLRFTLSGAPNGVPAQVMMGSLQNMLLVFLEAYGIPRARVFVQDGLAIITIKGSVDDPTDLRRVIEEEVVHIQKKTVNSYAFFKLCLAEIGGQVANLQRASSDNAQRIDQVNDGLIDLNLRMDDVSQGLDELMRPALPAPVTVINTAQGVNKTPAINKTKDGRHSFSLRKLWSS